MQAEALRDSFPPSDKSLSKLLGESPYLPKSVLKILENMCSPGNGDKGEKELHSLNADRVTQGLSTVWSLILLRPPIRDTCLQIALQVFFSYFCYTNFDVCLVVLSLLWIFLIFDLVKQSVHALVRYYRFFDVVKGGEM